MSKHLERDLIRLSDRVSELGSLVVDATAKCNVMLQNFDRMIADEIVENEQRINDMEVDLEEECLKVMALHQPVASDLRFLIVVLKVNNDLERMGDQVVNIAERIKHLADKERIVADLDLVAMGQTASSMVSQVMVALVKRDADAAKHILAMDDDLDAMHARSYRVLKDTMQQQPDIVHQAVSYLTISSNLERLGDLATNIAEEIIFMEEGEVVRHLDGVPLE